MKLRLFLPLIILTYLPLAVYGQNSNWYIDLGAGPAFSGDLAQEGFNFDPFCYPGYLCDSGSVTVENLQPGYRWFYEIPTDLGFAFQVGAGREHGSLRIDLNFRYSSRNLGQIFSQITLLDGSPVPEYDPNSGVISTVTATIGRLKITSVRINTFLDLFPSQGRTFRPYLGIGTGVSRATVTDLYFEERFSCEIPPCKGDISSYDSGQNEDLQDIVLLAGGHAGFEYVLTDKILIGIRFSYTLHQDLSSEGTYFEHKQQNLTNSNNFGNLNLITTMATVRYQL